MKLSPLFNRSIRYQIQNLLASHADALIAGTLDREQALEPYDNVIRDHADSLLLLAERLTEALVEVSPSDQFASALRYRLVETALSDQATWWDRLRSLPPRTQWAAGIGGATLTAGVVLIATRSMPNALEFWRNRRDM